jgi:hypothetical protein
MKVKAHHDLYDKNNHAKFQGQNIHQNKVIKSTNIGSCCGNFFIAANFDNLSKIKLYFIFHEIFRAKTSLC